MRRAGSRSRRTSRRRSASRPARRRACPTANIACICCSAPFRRRPRSRRLRASRKRACALQLMPIYGVTIPVIVRLGNLQATAGISNVHLERKDGKEVVGLELSRTGTRSTFGEVRVLKAGREEPDRDREGGRGLHGDRRAASVAVPVDAHTRARSPGRSPCNMSRPSTTARRARRNSGSPPLGAGAARGIRAVLGGAQLAAQGGDAAGAVRRRRCCICAGAVGGRRAGAPTPTSSSCSTSTSVSCGSATACAPTTRPRAHVSS